MSKSLLDVFPELGTPEPTTKIAIEKAPPDAVVLVVNKINCRCGEDYTSPNPSVMLRYGRNIGIIKEWSDIFNQLPREVLVRTETSMACESCFPNRIFKLGDQKRPAGEVLKRKL